MFKSLPHFTRRPEISIEKLGKLQLSHKSSTEAKFWSLRRMKEERDGKAYCVELSNPRKRASSGREVAMATISSRRRKRRKQTDQMGFGGDH